MRLKTVRLSVMLMYTALSFAGSAIQAQTAGAKAVRYDPDEKTGTSISFTESSWDEAVKMATERHKYIFVDAYASWCGPCKLLKSTTFRNKEVASFYNEHFINLSIDMEKGEGTALSAEWHIEAYPTLIIFDGTGKPVLETLGYIKPKDLLKFGQQALNKKAE